MKRRSNPKPFKELEQEWYGRLEKSGFEDIENTSHPDRPLKEWHSRKFCSERSRMRQIERQRYNSQIDDFINANGIREICNLIASHGNRTVKPQTVGKVLEFHREGLTERKIAKKIRRSKNCVHRILISARDWMKVA